MNVQGWRSKEVEVGQLLKEQGFDVFGVAETFLRNDWEVQMEGYKWFGVGRTGGGKASGGVGMLVQDSLRPQMRGGRDGAVLWVECNGGRRKVMIGVVYINPEGVRVAETKRMYEKLEQEVKEMREQGKVILTMGDFNGRIGAGRGGDEVINANGRREVASKDKQSTIDYMVVSKEDEHRVTKVTVDDEGQMDVGSDHCVLKLEVDMGRPKLSKPEDAEDARWKWKVDGKEDWSEYQAAVTEHMEGWEDWVKEATASRADHGEIVEVVWEKWKRRVTSAAERGIGLKKVMPARAKSWWDDEIEAAIEERRRSCRFLRRAQRDGRSRSEIGKEYKSKRRVVKKVIRRKKEEDRARTLRFIQENGGTQCKLFWSDLKRRGKKRSGCIMESKNHEGDLLTDPEDVKERLRKYWEELGKSVGAGRHTEQEDQGGEMEVEAMTGNVDRISMEEILYALRNLERGKAAGPDGVLNEMFGGEKMISSMRALFNSFTELEEYPQEWRRSLIVPVFKDGDREELDNYRGIALSCTVGKS